MKKYFAHLRPLERRLAVGVAVILILVLNFVFVWPHFSDWSRLKNRLKNAHDTWTSYQAAITQTQDYAAKVKALEGQGEFVAPEDQAINFMRTIQSQSAASGVNINSYSRSTMQHEPVFHGTDAKYQRHRHGRTTRGLPLQTRLRRFNGSRA